MLAHPAKSIERKFRVDGQQLVAQENYRVGHFACCEAKLPLVALLGKRILQEPFERHFAERATRFCTAQNVLQRLRGLRHLLASLLHRAELLLNLAQGFAGILEFAGHRRLRLSRDGCRVSDAFLQSARNTFEALGHILVELPELLAEILGLSRESLQVPLQLLHARARLFFFSPGLPALQEEPACQHNGHCNYADQKNVHFVFPFACGKRGVSTLAEVEGRTLEVGTEESWALCEVRFSAYGR